MQFILLFAWVDLVAGVGESGLAELISNSQKFSHVLAGHFRVKFLIINSEFLTC